MKLDILKTVGFGIKKYSPEIFLGAGIGCVISAGIMACQATLRVDDILEEKRETIEKINEVREAVKSDDPVFEDYTEETYSDKDYRQDIFITYSRFAKRFLRLYGPAIFVGAAGIGAILYGHNILNKRNVAVTAAYTALKEGYSEYRKRVVDELGEEADKRFRYGIQKKDVKYEEEQEDGTVKEKTAKDATVIDGYTANAKFFDAASCHWCKSAEYNLSFLKSRQAYANDLLNTNGHLFLNEVYDMLDIPRTSAGAVEGWIKDGPNGFVDFGLYKDARFVNGYENVVLLDFNVDGVIYQMI